MANQINFRSCDNGDIIAEQKDDNILMGMWFHKRREGTIRVTDPDHRITTLERRGGVTGVYVTKSLNEWFELMMKLGTK